jgi:Protein of unknown function (DUF1616)
VLRRNLDLWVVMAAAVVGLAAQIPGMPGVVRAASGLALAVFCPGYALVAALFPGDSLRVPERALLSLGLSLAVAMMGALLFNWLPWGLQTLTGATTAGGVTLAAGLVAAARRRYEPLTAAVVQGVHRLEVRQWALLGLAALVTAGAVIWVRVPRPATGILGYTQLWMLADEQDANRIHLGFRSSELSTTGFRLTVTLDGKLVFDNSDSGLPAGGTWERDFELPGTHAGSLIEAVLYRLDDPGVAYRRVVLQPVVTR